MTDFCVKIFTPHICGRVRTAGGGGCWNPSVPAHCPRQTGAWGGRQAALRASAGTVHVFWPLSLLQLIVKEGLVTRREMKSLARTHTGSAGQTRGPRCWGLWFHRHNECARLQNCADAAQQNQGAAAWSASLSVPSTGPGQHLPLRPGGSCTGPSGERTQGRLGIAPCPSLLEGIARRKGEIRTPSALRPRSDHVARLCLLFPSLPSEIVNSPILSCPPCL